MTATATTDVASRSLMGDSPATHIDPKDVEEYLQLAMAGVVPAKMHNGCAAVQDNISLRHDTRTTLTRKAA